MTRLLIVIFWCVVAYLLIRAWKRRSSQRDQQPDQSPDKTTPTSDSKAMVPCARCGVYLPESEAVIGDGQAYCSSEHRRLGSKRHG